MIRDIYKGFSLVRDYVKGPTYDKVSAVDEAIIEGPPALSTGATLGVMVFGAQYLATKAIERVRKR